MRVLSLYLGVGVKIIPGAFPGRLRLEASQQDFHHHMQQATLSHSISVAQLLFYALPLAGKDSHRDI